MILQNYIWFAPSYFSKREIDDVLRLSATLPEDEGMIGIPSNDADAADGDEHGSTDDQIRSSNVKWFTENALPEEFEQKLADGINKANLEAGWNHSWEYKENTQFTIYNAQPEKAKGDFYTWHTDAGPIPYDNGLHRKLSCTIQVSDPDDYEGGHFQWLEPQRQFDKMKLKPTVDIDQCVCTAPFSSKEIGSLIVFPSFLYHQVTPITRGIRKSMVSWFVGKPYV